MAEFSSHVLKSTSDADRKFCRDSSGNDIERMVFLHAQRDSWQAAK